MFGCSNTVNFFIVTLLFFSSESLFLLLFLEVRSIMDGLLPFLLLYLLVGLAS
jgi:hypothetical protein